MMMAHKIKVLVNLLCLVVIVPATGAFDDNATAFTIVKHPLLQATHDDHTRTVRNANRPNPDGQPTLVYVGFYVESVGALDCIKNVRLNRE